MEELGRARPNATPRRSPIWPTSITVATASGTCARPLSPRTVAGVPSGLFNFGLDQGIVDASPASGIRRVKEVGGRENFVSPQEIRSLRHRLDDADMMPQLRVAIRFTLATGQRRAEVAGLLRSEIDDDAALWTLPGERAKNGRENLTPLPSLVMGLVEEADKLRVRPKPVRLNRKDRPEYDPAPSPFLFPSRLIGKPIEPAVLTRAMNRNRNRLGIWGARFHDLRRSFATWQGEIGTAPEILSALLNRTVPGIPARDNRAANIERRRAAMERWCVWLGLVIDGKFAEAKAMQGADVVPIAREVEAAAR